jgi:nondiscriminating aspartyl-tRNA synthetase
MERILTNKISEHIGKEITLSGWVHKLRKMGAISFLVIRDRSGLAQAIIEKDSENSKLNELTTETVIQIKGVIVAEERAPHGAEMHVSEVIIISPVKEDIPIAINKKELNVNIDTLLDNRPITLRALKQKAIFRIQGIILNSFREFLLKNDFVEIHSPKIVSSGVETGGAEMFAVNYFGRKAFLSQSPQMYKQMLVGVYERVFEASCMFRAEKHSTSRHLNEYISMDLEMGFIDSFDDIMNLEQEFLEYLIKTLNERCPEDLELLQANMPVIPKKVPRMKLFEAQEILEKEYKEKCLGNPDLDPKQEKLICEYTTTKMNSEFVFITHYPSKKRPFYTYDDPKNPKETLSFDLLFRGLEITTGGQRLHLYEDYITKMKDRGMDTDNFTDYLSVFKFGMPPHGGLAIGLERLTAKLLGLENVREASFFPRDINRLKP